MKANYVIRAGETLNLSLLVVEGDFEGVAQVSAVLKAAGPNGSVPPTSAPSVATFVVTEMEMPDVGWDLYLSDEVTMPIKPGFYVTNARLDLVGGSVMKTEPILIEIKGSVS